jgi:hypothetical protein
MTFEPVVTLFLWHDRARAVVVQTLLPRAALAALGAGAGGGAPPSFSPLHIKEPDTYGQQAGSTNESERLKEKRAKLIGLTTTKASIKTTHGAQHAPRETERQLSFIFSTLQEGVGAPPRARLLAYRFPPNAHRTLSNWLAPGELPVEAQFTGFQQGARGASLVTNNRPRWCADIETGYIGP